jgi:hypothetical protein
LGESLVYACSRQDWHGNTVDGHANFLGPRFLSGPERVVTGSIGSPKLHGEWAEVRGVADPGVAGCREPRKHHDQENEK